MERSRQPRLSAVGWPLAILASLVFGGPADSRAGYLVGYPSLDGGSEEPLEVSPMMSPPVPDFGPPGDNGGIQGSSPIDGAFKLESLGFADLLGRASVVSVSPTGEVVLTPGIGEAPSAPTWEDVDCWPVVLTQPTGTPLSQDPGATGPERRLDPPPSGSLLGLGLLLIGVFRSGERGVKRPRQAGPEEPLRPFSGTQRERRWN